ncbi:MAG: gliding motility-associated C-terminal domain-containing protein, partial [Flavobacteriales bacterium]
CKGDTAQIGRGPLEGQEYNWNPTRGLSDSTATNPFAYPDTTTVYTVSMSFYGCDTIKDDVRVKVNPLPDADAGKDVTIVEGERTILEASGGVEYNWWPLTNLNDPKRQRPTVYPKDTTVYHVDVTSIMGCTDNDSVQVNVVEPELFIPKAFTPDGSGRNDVFRVRGERLLDFEMRIFDRSGEQIFVTENFDKGWDGRIRPTMEKAPEGAYMYYIKGKKEGSGEVIERKKMINLIR